MNYIGTFLVSVSFLPLGAAVLFIQNDFVPNSAFALMWKNFAFVACLLGGLTMCVTGALIVDASQ